MNHAQLQKMWSSKVVNHRFDKNGNHKKMWINLLYINVNIWKMWNTEVIITTWESTRLTAWLYLTSQSESRLFDTPFFFYCNGLTFISHICYDRYITELINNKIIFDQNSTKYLLFQKSIIYRPIITNWK